MSERKELRNLQLENVRLETELTEASQRLEDQAAEHSRNETQLQSEVNKLIDSLRDEKVSHTDSLHETPKIDLVKSKHFGYSLFLVLFVHDKPTFGLSPPLHTHTYTLWCQLTYLLLNNVSNF